MGIENAKNSGATGGDTPRPSELGYPQRKSFVFDGIVYGSRPIPVESAREKTEGKIDPSQPVEWVPLKTTGDNKGDEATFVADLSTKSFGDILSQIRGSNSLTETPFGSTGPTGKSTVEKIIDQSLENPTSVTDMMNKVLPPKDSNPQE